MEKNLASVKKNPFARASLEYRFLRRSVITSSILEADILKPMLLLLQPIRNSEREGGKAGTVRLIVKEFPLQSEAWSDFDRGRASMKMIFECNES